MVNIYSPIKAISFPVIETESNKVHNLINDLFESQYHPTIADSHAHGWITDKVINFTHIDETVHYISHTLYRNLTTWHNNIENLTDLITSYITITQINNISAITKALDLLDYGKDIPTTQITRTFEPSMLHYKADIHPITKRIKELQAAITNFKQFNPRYRDDLNTALHTAEIHTNDLLAICLHNKEPAINIITNLFEQNINLNSVEDLLKDKNFIHTFTLLHPDTEFLCNE